MYGYNSTYYIYGLKFGKTFKELRESHSKRSFCWHAIWYLGRM